MPTFLYTARNPDSRQVTERLDAANTGAARYALETRGYTDITFHTDEFGADVDQSLNTAPKDPDLDEFWTPEMELENRRRGGILAGLWFAFKMNKIFWVPLLLWDLYSVVKGPPFGFWAWTGFVLTLVFVAYFFTISLPGVAYQCLLRAAVWARWSEVRTWVRLIRLMKRCTLVPIPEFELDMRLAVALASEGKLDEALAKVTRYENDASLAKNLYFGRVASVYEAAHDYKKMAECQARAVQHGTGSATEHIDRAFGLIRRLRDTAGARQALAALEDKEITDLAAPYVTFCKGLIALEENRNADARTLLFETLEKSKPYASFELMTGFILEAKTFLAIALGNLGEMDKARRLLAEAEPFLTAQKETELLQRAQAAAGGLKR